jgi:hypothetical protein
VELGGTSQHTEGANHAYQPEAVVSVQMGNEDMAYLGKADVGTSELHLGSLSAVNHE